MRMKGKSAVSQLRKHCVPCEGGMPPLSKKQSIELLQEITGWELQGKLITKEWKFKDFKAAMQFVNAVAGLAESEGHHPDIHIHWNKVQLQLWTHAVKGLSENDFILAHKINQI